jgi:UDP-N-acetylglucosamine acyltransferase
MIHPTAIIDSRAEIDPTASIGPYAIIEGPVKLRANVKVEAHAQVLGDATIGAGTVIGRAAIIGADPQDLSFKPETESFTVIGENNVIREQVTIHRGSKTGSATRVGEGNFIMATAHFAHDVQIGNKNVIANAALLAGHVHVGNNVFIGGGSVFHQFIRIGDFCMFQGNSSFSKDLPPYCIGNLLNRVAGINVIGLRRAGFTAADRAEVKRVVDLLFRSGLNRSQALEAIAQEAWGTPAQRFIDFIQAPSKKGIARMHLKMGEPDDEE